MFISRESKWGTLQSAGNPRCAVPAGIHSICTDRRDLGPAAGLQVSPTSDTCQSVAILMKRRHSTFFVGEKWGNWRRILTRASFKNIVTFVQWTQKSLQSSIHRPTHHDINSILLQSARICVFAYSKTGRRRTHTLRGRARSPHLRSKHKLQNNLLKFHKKNDDLNSYWDFMFSCWTFFGVRFFWKGNFCSMQLFLLLLLSPLLSIYTYLHAWHLSTHVSLNRFCLGMPASVGTSSTWTHLWFNSSSTCAGTDYVTMAVDQVPSNNIVVSAVAVVFHHNHVVPTCGTSKSPNHRCHFQMEKPFACLSRFSSWTTAHEQSYRLRCVLEQMTLCWFSWNSYVNHNCWRPPVLRFSPSHDGVPGAIRSCCTQDEVENEKKITLACPYQPTGHHNDLPEESQAQSTTKSHRMFWAFPQVQICSTIQNLSVWRSVHSGKRQRSPVSGLDVPHEVCGNRQ